MSDEDDKDDFLREIDELLHGELENGQPNVKLGEIDDVGTEPTFGLEDVDVKDGSLDTEPLVEDSSPPKAPSPPKTEYVLK